MSNDLSLANSTHVRGCYGGWSPVYLRHGRHERCLSIANYGHLHLDVSHWSIANCGLASHDGH